MERRAAFDRGDLEPAMAAVGETVRRARCTLDAMADGGGGAAPAAGPDGRHGPGTARTTADGPPGPPGRVTMPFRCGPDAPSAAPPRARAKRFGRSCVLENAPATTGSTGS